MVPSSAGVVETVPFPFSDLSQTKLRPAVVLAGAGRPRRHPGPHCQPPLPPDARNEGTLRASASNLMVVAQMRLISRPRFDEYEPPGWASPAGNRASKCEALFWPPDAIEPLPN